MIFATSIDCRRSKYGDGNFAAIDFAAVSGFGSVFGTAFIIPVSRTLSTGA
jgi:hypothetical protein